MSLEWQSWTRWSVGGPLASVGYERMFESASKGEQVTSRTCPGPLLLVQKVT
ncbi:hypothetical protein M404DRAFT_994528 [Pisolithus tinctorius Marx 270]|uniref:Uncharacterized protein n=1 Tax=Pisolithus tinctorius Marx 270 TaxID=870435 RepID=A0A0C3PRZ0_PISTI|nr:hypothetical protein M404DRAFT_994528 [Pisolithus tinctorius Marx 270]